MSIHIEEGKTLGMWSVTLPKDFQYDENHVGGDWLCHLGYEEKDGERITVGTYRFRYYTKNPTGDPFKDKDLKKWWRVAIKDKTTEAYNIAAFRSVAEEMAKTTGGELYEYLVGNDFNGFMAKLMDSPVMFAKQATKQEYEEFEKTGKEPKS